MTKVSIKNTEFDKQVEQYVREFYVQLIDSAVQSAGLNLCQLTEVIITGEFKSDVNNFQREVNVPVEMTDCHEFICIAKTIWYQDINNKWKAKIFIASHVALSIFDTSTSKANPYSIGITTFYHELGHVHDDSYIEQQFGRWRPIAASARTDELRTGISKLIWSEFHAEYIASPINLIWSYELHSEGLLLSHKRIMKYISESHIKYQVNPDVSKLWHMVISETSSYLNQMGRLSPYLCYLSPKSKDDLISNLGIFGEILLSLECELNKLLSDFNKWKIWTWDGLNNLVCQTWEKCGVAPEDTDEGLFIHVLGVDWQ